MIKCLEKENKSIYFSLKPQISTSQNFEWFTTWTDKIVFPWSEPSIILQAIMKIKMEFHFEIILKVFSNDEI